MLSKAIQITSISIRITAVYESTIPNKWKEACRRWRAIPRRNIGGMHFNSTYNTHTEGK